jgi:putative FmdB family regulatory protein
MPTYRYRCAKCGDETEIWQSFDEKPKTRHTGGCGGKLQKVMSPAGIVLKGSGFYKTDNRSSKSGSKGGSNGAGKESSGSESSGSESKSSDSSSSTSSSGKKETASSSSSGSSSPGTSTS